MSLDYPPGIRAKIAEFPITAIWYDPSGKILTTQTAKAKVPTHWNSSVHSHGYGESTPGTWEPGLYRVTLKVGDQTLISGSFQIEPSGKAEEGVLARYGGRVTSLRFFESSPPPTPYGQREYQEKFAANQARYIFWEIMFKWAAGVKRTQKLNFPIHATWYDPDGKVLTTQTMQAGVGPQWQNSYHGAGFGSTTPGVFRPGVYRVVLAIEGEEVALGSFEVVGGAGAAVTPPPSAGTSPPGPAPGGEAAFDRLKAKVTGIKFFPTGKKIVPHGQRQYAEKFDASTTDYICWELSLDHPETRAQAVELPLTQTWYGPDGKILSTDTITREVPADLIKSRMVDGLGGPTPGYWKPGTFRLVLKVGDRTISSGSFQVAGVAVAAAPKGPSPGGEAEFSRLNAQVAGVKFFFGKQSTVPHGQRQYAGKFDEDTWYIFWELSLDHPGPRAGAVIFPLTAVWYEPDGKILETRTTAYEVQPESNASLITGRYIAGFGWPLGTSRVVFKVGDKTIGSGHFQVEKGWARKDFPERYGAKAISLRFYEEGPTPVPVGQRIYQEKFAASETRRVMWELKLNWAPGKNTPQVALPLTATWYGPDDKVLTTQTLNAVSDPQRQESLHVSGYGAAAPGVFKSGTYQVVIKNEDQEVAKGTFHIYGAAAGGLAAFSSLNARVKGIRFFPANVVFRGDEPYVRPYGEREYPEKFDFQKDSIFWELSLDHPGPRAKAVEFPITAIWYDPAGKVLFTQTVDCQVQPGSSSSIHIGGCLRPGMVWKEGTYQVILKVGDKTISNGIFEIEVPMY